MIPAQAAQALEFEKGERGLYVQKFNFNIPAT